MPWYALQGTCEREGAEPPTQASLEEGNSRGLGKGRLTLSPRAEGAPGRVLGSKMSASSGRTRQTPGTPITTGAKQWQENTPS